MRTAGPGPELMSTAVIAMILVTANCHLVYPGLDPFSVPCSLPWAMHWR